MTDLRGLGFTLGSVRIVSSPFLYTAELVKRTWRERLLSWPWRPFGKWKSIKIPDPKIYCFDDGDYGGMFPSTMYVGHPVTVKKLLDEIPRTIDHVHTRSR